MLSLNAYNHGLSEARNELRKLGSLAWKTTAELLATYIS